MSIPRAFIDQLLAKIDIIDLIHTHVPLQKKSGNNYFARCPFHQEKSASFSVSQHKQFYYCFGCGAHGNAIDFLMQRERLPFPEAIETLARLAGMIVPDEARATVKNQTPAHLYELTEHIARYYYEQLKKSQRTIEYLKKRGVSGKIAKLFQLGYAENSWHAVLDEFRHSPDAEKSLLATGMVIQKKEGGYYDRFRDRLMFPILDYRGRTIGFGGRIIDAGEPKYLNSPETTLFQKGHELYGLYYALKSNRVLKKILIVEGYMDVIALFQHDITYAVATLGTATTTHHLNRLFRHTEEIIFCFDGDEAGRTAAWRALIVLLPVMQDHLQIRFLFLPDGEDPDSLVNKIGKNEFEKLLSTAPSLSDFFFRELMQQCDLNNMEGRARLAKLAMQHIDTLPDGIFRQILLQELSKRTRVDVGDLKHQLQTGETTLPEVIKKEAPHAASSLSHPMRQALALLIQTPSLIKNIQTPLPVLSIPGMDLLQQLMAHMQANPTMHTGMLIELFRDQPIQPVIVTLSEHAHHVPEHGQAAELKGALRRLEQIQLDQQIDTFMSRMSLGQLSIEEKKTLTELISKKQAFVVE